MARSFAHATSALVVSGTRVLDGEFTEAALARQVITAVGGRGERTFAGIQQSPYGTVLNATSLTSQLELLSRKRILAADEPLSVRRAMKDRRWRVADPALRFWLAFVEPALGDVDRGRPDLALVRFEAGYAAWRGRAVEAVVREALWRLLPDDRWREVTTVGGWWPRNNTPEVDLVGAAGRPASAIGFVGSIKWRRDKPVLAAEVNALARDAVRVPGVTAATDLVAVCPAGAPGTEDRLRAVWTAEDLLEAWP